VYQQAVPLGLGRVTPHALVIAHDSRHRADLVQVLSEAGYPTTSESSGASGLVAAKEGQPDLVVLGPVLPEVDTLELLPQLRRTVPGLAVVVVGADADEDCVVATLDAGADDCLTAPSGTGTLVARVRAVLRRGREQPAPRSVLRLNGLTIDLAARRAELDGAPLVLSPREFDLLAYLALRVGQVVSKRELLAEVWRLTYDDAERATDKTVDVHVSWLRRKLRESAQRPRYLHTVRGVGLRLDIPRENTA
jgi:DNA-binding response OmpR family regulator